MSYNSMMADFTAILNRDDCSAAQAATFMQQGVQRIQRTCRIPSMERQQIITVGDQPCNFIVSPPDLIQPIDLIWTPAPTNGRGTKSQALTKLGAYRDLLKKNPLDRPRWYARLQAQFWIAGTMITGETLQFFYYGNFSPWVSGASDNELSASTPDLGVYAALGYAGDYFECALAAQWESRFQEIKGEVTQMGEDLDAEGGEQVMQPIYQWD